MPTDFVAAAAAAQSVETLKSGKVMVYSRQGIALIDMLPVILVFLRLPQPVCEEHLLKAGNVLSEF